MLIPSLLFSRITSWTATNKINLITAQWIFVVNFRAKFGTEKSQSQATIAETTENKSLYNLHSVSRPFQKLCSRYTLQVSGPKYNKKPGTSQGRKKIYSIMYRKIIIEQQQNYPYTKGTEDKLIKLIKSLPLRTSHSQWQCRTKMRKIFDLLKQLIVYHSEENRNCCSLVASHFW